MNVHEYAECFILLQVGDILFIGPPLWGKLFPRAISVYEHGDVECLVDVQPIAYCGMQIYQTGDRVISVSRKDFYPKLASLGSAAIVKSGKFIVNEMKRRRAVKSFAAECLWLAQCRYDLCFPVCQLASGVIDASRLPEKMLKFIVDSRRVLPRGIKYHHEIKRRNFLSTVNHCPFPQITTFSDAPFDTLRDSGSVESACVLFAMLISRDGAVFFRGHSISWNTRRILRVFRSAANSECVALNVAFDLTIYLHVIISEFLTGHYNVDFLTRPTVLPMMNLSKPSPSSLQMQQEFQTAAPEISQLTAAISPTNSSVSYVSGSSAFLNMPCLDCFSSVSIPLGELAREYDILFGGDGVASSTSGVCRSDQPLIHAMALSGCANISACLSRGNPRTQDRSTRLIINAIKDAMGAINVSFRCAPSNLSDVGAKANSTLGIYYMVASSNLYRIGFMSRKDCRQVLDSLRPTSCR